MTAQIIVCQACNAEVHGEIYHLGFCDMQALYCSSCPKVLLLKDRELLPSNGISWPNLTAADPGFEFYDRHLLPVYASIEALFDPCECGGRYLYMAPPHCPKCGGLLRGDCYEDKPILKERDGYVFVSAGSVTDHEQLKQLA
ncbi:hypothetical protein [Rhodanobacter sp. C06]|uniref:hypothetical protein n=1 Tax=Rhodanobacter sp. C06 TaxID=1945854 RepID=UPI0011154B0B|nr:hypothetical protein [Rhodanobacter sp. C06]